MKSTNYCHLRAPFDIYLSSHSFHLNFRKFKFNYNRCLRLCSYICMPFKTKEVRKVLSIFLGMSFFLFAPVTHAQKPQPIWQEYLEYLKNDAAKDWMGDLKQLKLLKYTYKGKVKSEKDKYRVIEAACSDKAPAVSVLSNLVISDTTYTETGITIHQKTYPEFKIVTVRQMVDAGKLTEDSIAMLKQRLYENIDFGFGYVKLDWLYKGKKFSTLGIIPNDGIPVDPIISHLSIGGNAIVESRTSPIRKSQNACNVYTPVDSVPEWVKEKVTQEEYNLWKTMSSVYQIDYSFLKRNIPNDKRNHFYSGIKQMCESIKKGEYSSKKGELFAVSMPAPIDTSLIWRVNELTQIDDSIQFCNRRSIIYRSEHWKNVYLECSVWYVYDSLQKDVDIIKYEILSPLPFSRFQGSLILNLQNDRISLRGECAGTIEYYDKELNYRSETVQKSFIVPLMKLFVE